MLPRRFSFAVLVAVALLLSGCATGPKRHINACNAIATDAVENIECVQSRLRADPSTPMGVQARVDFLAVAAHSLRSRVRAGQITREQAQLTYSSLGRELDASPSYASTAYVSKQTLDILGLPTDTNAFSQYVQPAVEAARTFTSSAISKGGGAVTDPAPCVTATCGPVSVKGYYRKDGTYVRPHTRSAPGAGRGRR